MEGICGKESLYEKFVQDFSKNLRELTQEKEFSEIIIVCIGTDRITGDSFGPLVGYKLKYLYKETNYINVFGDLDNTINSKNIVNLIRLIKNKYSNPFIIALDSTLARDEDIGKIIVEKGSITIGSALDKRVAYIGDLSVKAVVARNLKIPSKNFSMLQNIPLGRVMKMVDVVSTGIYNVIA